MNYGTDSVVGGPRRVLLLAGVALAVLVAAPAVAHASTDYWVEACAPSAGNVFSFSTGDSVNLDGSDSNCAVSDTAGFATSDLANGTQEPLGTSAGWSVSAPTGETIQSLYYTGGSFTTSGGGWIAGWQGNDAAGNGLTTELDPDAGNDCNATPASACSVSNSSEILGFGPGTGVGPLTEIALEIACVDLSCHTGGDSASVGATNIELVDPNDSPAVNASVSNTNVNNGYDSAASELSLSYSAYDPGGVCDLKAQLVTASGDIVSSTSQGTSSPASDSENGYFMTTLPCGSGDTTASSASTYTFTPTLAALPSGNYYLRVLADNPGGVFNDSSPATVWQSSAIKVDNSTPTVSVSTSAQSGTWYSAPQQVIVSAADAGGSSGVEQVICTGPGTPGAAQPIPATQLPYTITVPGSGAQTIACHAISNSGVSSTTGSTTVDIDAQAPTTTLGGADAAPAVLAAPAAVTIMASESQPASGIASSDCTVTNGAGSPQSYTISGASGQLAATAFHDGKNAVSCVSTTNAGVAGPSASETIEVDDQQPVVTFGGATPTPALVTGDQQVTATAAEPNPSEGFGVGSVNCQVNGGAWKDAQADHQGFDFPIAGTYGIACYAISVAGVQGPTATETIQIDDAAPSAGQPVVSGGSSTNLSGWAQATQQVTLTFTAAGGGTMSEVQCSLNGRQLTLKPGDAGVTIGPDGTTETVVVPVPAPGGTLVCQGLDSAGNWSQPVSRSFEIDDTPPAGQFEPTDRDDPTLVRALVTDSGSGVATAVIQLEERSGWKDLATHYDASTHLATATVPDDGSIPDGTYQLRVDARDVAGNVAMLDRDSDGKLQAVTLPIRALTRLTAVVSQGTARVATVAEASAAAKRRQAIVRSLTLAYGQRSRLAGDLTTSRGVPIAGALIRVEQVVESAKPTVLVTLRTDVTGGFVYSIPAGPTRTLELVYGGTKVLRTSFAAASLQVIGRAMVTVGARPVAGRPLTISGRVPGGWVPAGGLLVQLWYEIKGDAGGWAPFEHAIHSGRDGSWQLTFPVSSRAAGYTYEFKAVVSQQAGWPFLGATSEVVTRTVT